MPEETEQLKTVVENIDMLFSRDENFVLSRKHYEEVFSLLVDVKEKYSIVNNPTAFMKIVEMAENYMAEHYEQVESPDVRV